uniref:Peptidase S1 domain-containing protein n=1 Tax=Panagrolaimus davidi TaxID=227884 RepID=A0A914NZP7_9BILA
MQKNFLFLVFFAKFAVIYGFNENRIRSGVITPSDLFQFAVKLHSPKSSCTASVISKRYILTAAHCIRENESTIIPYDRYKLYLEVPYHADIRPNSSDGEMRSPNSTKAYLPKTYSRSQWPWNDMAILEFPEGTDFGIEPVKLAKDYYEKEGDEAYIIGFGRWWLNESNGSMGRSDVLRHAKITMVNNCYGTLKICGGNVTHRALRGDSGGPMVIYRNNQWYQIGVSAATSPYDKRTRISSFCNFIEEVTKNEVKCESIFPERNNIKLPIKTFAPIYKGQSTPIKLFNFVVPLYNYYYNKGCTATVISKRHLLTSAFCVYRNWHIRESKVLNFTESSKTFTGKFFPDFRTKIAVQSNFKNEPVNVIAYFPLKYVSPWDHNIAVIEYPKNTDFGIEPVTLAKNFIPIYLDNSSFVLAGFGLANIKKNDEKLTYEGGPILYEKNGKFYQIAVYSCLGTPNGSRTSVTRECEFIEKVTKNEVKCESVEPIYIYPTTTTKKIVLPSKYNTVFQNEHIYSKPSSMASKIQFNLVLLIIFILQ